MLKKYLAVASLLICLATLSGCRKSQIESELKELEPQHALAQQQLDEADRAISSLQTRTNELATGIRNRNTQTGAYLKEHVLAVTCMAAVGYSVGTDNVFSDDVNKMINAGSLLCVVGVVFSEDFRNEVSAVVETLESSSKEIKEMRAELTSRGSELNAAKLARVPRKKQLDEINARIQSLQAELSTL